MTGRRRARLRWRGVLTGLAALAASAVVPEVRAATFPTHSDVKFQTSGCRRCANIGDWYTTANGVGGLAMQGGTCAVNNGQATTSTARYSEFFLEVTASMAPATVTVIDADSDAGGPIADEVQGGVDDDTRFEIYTDDGAGTLTFVAGQTVLGSAGPTDIVFAGLGVGLYRIRSYDGSDQIDGVACGTGSLASNDDDNNFQIQVNGGSAIDGLLGFLQTTYQQNSGSSINYQMYFIVGPNTVDTSLALRNFDLDGGGSAVYTRPPDGTGGSTNGTASGNAVWNNGGSLNSGQDSITADTDLASGAQEAGTWGYRINGFTNNNQTIFEANAGGLRLALTDALPTRAGFFSITPDTTRSTSIGVATDHPFTITNMFFTNDVINFTLSGTRANYTTQLRTDPDCDGNGSDGAPLTDNDADGRVDTNLRTQAGTAGASACYVLRVTPLAGASISDTTRINAVSLMDDKVSPGSNTVRFVEKTTLLPPSISKGFSPNPLATGGTATLTFTLGNVNTVPAALGTSGPGFAFTDVFPVSPGAMTLANTSVTNTCGGTLSDSGGGTLNAGDVGIRYSGGSIPAAGTCTVAVNVTASATGDYDNTSTAIVSTNAGTGNVANATLTVQSSVPPSIGKSFGTSPIAVNGTSRLTLTVANSNPFVLSGVAFNDAYPAGLVNAATPNVANSCGGTVTGGAAGGTSIGLSGGSVAAGASCSVSVDVTSAANGSYNNVTGAVTSTNAGTGNSANATLVVHAPPTVSKSFSPNPINVNGTSVLTITLTNPNSSAMTAASFTDAYPAGIANEGVPDAATTCGGSVTAAAGGSSVALAGGTLPANGSCNVTVNVTSSTPGTRNNDIPVGAVTTTNGIGNAVAANASLTAQAIVPPNIIKTFSPATIQVNGTSVLTLTLTNPNVTATLIGVAVNDVYPGGIVNRTPASPAVSCTAGSAGAFTGGADGGNSIGFTGGSLLAGGSCTITVNVTRTGTGGANNVTGNVTSTNGGTGGTANAMLTGTSGLVPPTISKAFDPDEPGVSGTSRLTFTIANPNNATLYNVSFNDTYPAGLVNATPPNVTNTCDFGGNSGPTVTGGSAGGNSIGLSGATGAGGSRSDIPANTTCTLAVDVTSASAGVYNNVTTAITGRDGNGSGAATLTGGTAAAAITFVRPTITKSFGPDVIAAGGTSILTLVLGNGSDVAFGINTPGFTDTFPAGVTVASPLTTTNTCGGTLVDNAGGGLNAGDTGIRLNGGTLPAKGTCQVTVNVTSATTGTHVNTVAAGNLSTSGGTNATAATASLTVPVRPGISKQFSAATIPVLGVSTLTLTLSNDNGIAATGATLTDTLPAGLVTSGAPSTNCGGTVSSTTSTVSLSGGTIPAGAPGTCTVTINVLNNADTGASVALAAGVYVNDIPAGALSTGFGTNPAPASANLNVAGGYKSVIVQADADGSGGPTVGDTLEWSVFFRNPAGGASIPGFQATDAVGGGMTVTGAPAVTLTPSGCSAGVTPSGSFDGVGSTNLFDGVFTFNPGCTVRVNYLVSVDAAAAGTTLSNQASGSGSGLVAVLTDNVDAGTTGLPAGVAPAGGSVAQAQFATVISPTTVAIPDRPSLTVVKSAVLVSDPVNATTNPKHIPGAFVDYSVVVTNTGGGSVDNNTTVIFDPIPAGLNLFVGDLAGGSPVEFTDGALPSGLTFTFTSLSSATDDVSFSNDGGATYAYVPVPDGNGVDAAVTHLRINPKGGLSGDAPPGPPSPSFSVRFRVRVE